MSRHGGLDRAHALISSWVQRTPSFHYDVDFRIANLDKDIKWNKDDAARAWAAFSASQPSHAEVIAGVRGPRSSLFLRSSAGPTTLFVSTAP